MVKSNIKFNNKTKKINKLILILLVFITVFIGLYVYKYGLTIFKFNENNYKFDILDNENIFVLDNKILNNLNNNLNNNLIKTINNNVSKNIILGEAKKDLKEKFDSIFENNLTDDDNHEFEYQVGEDITQFQQDLNKWKDIDNISDNILLMDYYKFNTTRINNKNKSFNDELNNIPFSITDELDEAYHVAFTELKKKNNRLNKNYTEYPLSAIADLG